MIGVRIAHAEPRLGQPVSGQPPDPRLHGLRPRGFLVVLAEEAGHRAMPAWVPDRPETMPLPDLLDRPDDDIWTTAGVPEELLIRLLNAAGGAVTAVDILPADADAADAADASDAAEVAEVTEQTCTTRIGLGAGRHIEAPLDLGLAVAVIAGAPVRVAEDLMDRLAVPVPDEDPAAPFRAHEPERETGGHVIIDPRAGRVFQVTRDRRASQRPRHEPRNLAFADGLDRWELDAGFREETGPDDYSAGTEDGCAFLSATAGKPRGSAVLVQSVFADDFRGAAVGFRAEFRTDGVEGRAGLCLEILRPGWRVSPERAEDRVVIATGNQGWTRQEISAHVPEDADLIRFGVLLSGRGRVWLRNPELRTARPGG